MTDTLSFQSALAALSIEQTLRFRETRESAVTTNWRVNWDAEMVARDLMQNFIDANKGNFDAIVIRRINSLVAISAPAEFDLHRLYYLGSEKDTEDIGNFGEGFKAAAVCVLRDTRASLYCLSGPKAVRIRLAKGRVENSGMRPLAYDFFTLSARHLGTMLVLTSRSPELAAAIEGSKRHFEWSGNPALSHVIWEAGPISVRHSADEHGAIFYRGLRRGELKHFPLVFSLKVPTPRVERLTATDRDRKAFGPEVINAFVADYFSRKLYPAAFPTHFYAALLEAGKLHWRTGHAVLKALAEKRPPSPAERSQLRTIFADNYFANDSQSYASWEDRLSADVIARDWEAAGRTKLPNYFAAFGLESPSGVVRAKKRQLLAELKQSRSRPPSQCEERALAILDEVLATFAPAIKTLFEGLKRQYLIVDSKTILGELRTGRSYNEKIVLLSVTVFVGEFAEAVATHLHEHAHILGYDGSRAFTDALTSLIETILKRREEFAPFERQWAVARDEVERERTLAVTPSEAVTMLTQMDEAALRAILARIPNRVLREFIEPTLLTKAHPCEVCAMPDASLKGGHLA